MTSCKCLSSLQLAWRTKQSCRLDHVHVADILQKLALPNIFQAVPIEERVFAEQNLHLKRLYFTQLVPSQSYLTKLDHSTTYWENVRTEDHFEKLYASQNDWAEVSLEYIVNDDRKIGREQWIHIC